MSVNPTTTALLLAIGLAVYLVFWVFGPKAKYSAAGPIFTPAEMRFYRALTRAVREDHLVFGKVRVADLVTVEAATKKAHLTEHGRIAQKHIDFVVLDRTSLEIICAVELNDKSHGIHSRRQRDVFLKRVFSEAKVPLVWIEARSRYALSEIASAIYSSPAQ